MNQHVSKLQASVGLQSGTVQELSPRALQEVASNSAKPKQFVEKYKEAAAKVSLKLRLTSGEVSSTTI